MTSDTATPHQHLIANKKLRNFTINILAGGTAGIVEVCTMYPLDLVKTQAVGVIGVELHVWVTMRRSSCTPALE